MARNLITLLGEDDPPEAVLLAEADYWDTVVRGNLSHSGIIDPSLAATIARLHALDAAPLPDLRFAARLEQSLIDGGLRLRTSPSVTMPSATHGEPRPPRVLTPAGPPARRRTTNVFATAALVLLTLLGSLAAIGAVRMSSPDDRQGVDAGFTGSEVLLQGPVTIPETALWAGVVRYILQPGAELSLNGIGDVYEAMALYRVESGTLIIQPQGLMAITRAGAAHAEPSGLPGTESILSVGDQGTTPFGVEMRWRNGGDAPVSVLAAGVTTGGSPPTTPGVVKYILVDEMPFHSPTGQVQMMVGHITLQPKAILVAETLPGLEMLRAESGRLVAVDRQGTPLGDQTIGWATRSLGAFPPERAFASADGQSVSLLFVTLTDANLLETGG